MKKILIALLVFICLISVGIGTSQAENNVVWKLSHHRPVDSQLDKDMKAFAAEVDKKTNGRVKIQVFPAAQLGGSEGAMERVSMGSIEMMVGYPNSTLDPKLDIYSLPGTAKDFKELKLLFAKGSPYMNILEEIFDSLDITVLAAYTTAFTGMCFKGEPTSPLNPLANHKEKIRVPSINSYRYTAEALGYLTTPLPWGEVFTALQTGVVDGVYGPAAEPTYTTLRDVIKTYIPLNVQADMFFLIANKQILGSIGKEDQKIIKGIAAKMEASRFTKGAEEQKMWEGKMADKGIKVINLTDAQRSAFQKRIQEYGWPLLRKAMGEQFFDKTIDAWKKAMMKK
ncbi:MAG: TRAP transporter substrate-binding protein DctP [Synergistales bacterium]|jgi:TRAP-type C4-dicarboxylate transport system substrate-binding protein